VSVFEGCALDGEVGPETRGPREAGPDLTRTGGTARSVAPDQAGESRLDRIFMKPAAVLTYHRPRFSVGGEAGARAAADLRGRAQEFIGPGGRAWFRMMNFRLARRAN